ncbi:MAG TPA: DUF3703 domain-containing protein [Flavobacterium sp.]|uniref:DUF3703 domain-containing protein n=1 Tax=unclassified Flavobacterium TaxID=196869 RepID=UPI0025C5FEA5|nr:MULTISPECIES: DUF3703 domain-containing protein [unclassified Flavobacterium]HRE76815.1 DUF3703 domain-containing protein [Flavobacterium sp.]
MKFYTTLPKNLRPFYRKELENYQTEYSKGNLKKAWRHLERAHIIGQKYPFAHCYVHWKMMQYAFKVKNTNEIIGQIPRLFLGGIFSFLGKVPLGNPGGANVPPLKPFPIDQDIEEIFKSIGLDEM